MTRLRLVASAPGGPNVAELGTMAPERLPPGRHGLPANLVRTHQRQRLLEAASTALGEQGYGRLTAARLTELAGVSSRTFYQHFEDLWACLLAAYETEAGFLCAQIEDACEAIEPQDRLSRARVGIGAAIDFLAGEPAVARLLSAEPPPQIVPLAAARRDLTERLGTMLRQVLGPGGATPLPGLERRLIGAAMALVSARAAEGDPERLRELEPELCELLLASL
ncbi:MAG TPA: TetR/AcrR family transcriptional regulator [Solirubrobacterales bacterium]|nr:TetR/AcrR family transcriptional regulator [Solirubrobacterales bacterium]